MNQKKWNRFLLAAAAIGAIGLSTYGVYNTTSAFNEYGNALTTDNISLNTAEEEKTKPDGSFCNPYGCAGCDGCISLQYQQDVEMVPDLTKSGQIEQNKLSGREFRRIPGKNWIGEKVIQ
jgi:hypothetical protein